MAITLNPYLNFRDTSREAMTFYRSVFGGELTIGTFGEFHAAQDPSETDLVMHAQLEGEHGIVLMASDTPARMEYRQGNSMSVSLSGDDEPVLRRWFEQLCEGGSVTMPLQTSSWGDIFGMCTDRFGVQWLVNISSSANTEVPAQGRSEESVRTQA